MAAGMTWGNRAHRQNTKLYTGFTKADFRILHSGGILILVDGRIGRWIADPPGYTTNQTGIGVICHEKENTEIDWPGHGCCRGCVYAGRMFPEALRYGGYRRLHLYVTATR